MDMYKCCYLLFYDILCIEILMLPCQKKKKKDINVTIYMFRKCTCMVYVGMF
jgi:hypothetical protein